MLMLTQAELEAATGVLGSILLDASCLAAVRGEVSEDLFPCGYQRDLFRAACRLQDEGTPVDPVTVWNRVRAEGGDLEKRDILDLMDYTPTAVNVMEYCRLLRRQAVARTLAERAQRVAEELRAGHDPFVAGRELTECVRETAALEGAGAAVDSCEAMVELSDALIAAEEASPALPTGFPGLDRLLGGELMKGCLTILAARPGQGKTTLALAVAEQLAARGRRVLFVSLEMTRRQLSARRVAACLGTVTAVRVLTGQLEEAEIGRVTEAMSELSRRPLLFNRSSRAEVRDLRTMAVETGAELLVIDYLGLIRHREGRSLYERVTETSNRLKELTVELDLPVLCLAQLNREAENRAGRAPRLSDLRDSGAIEQDADAILLHRPEEAADGPLIPLDVLAVKNRYGPLGRVRLGWCLENGRIVEE